MAIPLDPNQLVSFEELLRGQMTQQEALTRILLGKGIFTKEEFLEMVRVVNEDIEEAKGRRGLRRLGRRTGVATSLLCLLFKSCELIFEGLTL
jgi:hypothetical protein